MPNKKVKRITRKLKRSYWFTLFIGITAAYFIWLTWNKLTEVIGNTTLVWGITGVILILAILVGHFSFRGLAKRYITK